MVISQILTVIGTANRMWLNIKKTIKKRECVCIFLITLNFIIRLLGYSILNSYDSLIKCRSIAEFVVHGGGQRDSMLQVVIGALPTSC